MTYNNKGDIVTLSPYQRQAVLDRLDDIRDNNGSFEVTVEFDNLTVTAAGEIELDGYREDDYYSGTGAWVETCRSASVLLTATDENGIEYGIDSDTYNMAYRALNAT